jgi:hypothetical protein
LRQVWEPLLFEDEELAVDRQRRDPVAPARASESARQKKRVFRGICGCKNREQARLRFGRRISPPTFTLASPR